MKPISKMDCIVWDGYNMDEIREFCKIRHDDGTVEDYSDSVKSFGFIIELHPINLRDSNPVRRLKGNLYPAMTDDKTGEIRRICRDDHIYTCIADRWAVVCKKGDSIWLLAKEEFEEEYEPLEER